MNKWFITTRSYFNQGWIDAKTLCQIDDCKYTGFKKQWYIEGFLAFRRALKDVKQNNISWLKGLTTEYECGEPPQVS